MARQIRILVVSDSPSDGSLVAAALRQSDLEPAWEQAQTPTALRAALEHPWDIVIAEYPLPWLGADGGESALRRLRDGGTDTPLLVISASGDEDGALAATGLDAHDCLPKSNLKRLPAAVDRALRDARMRRAHAVAQEALGQSEANFQAVVATAVDGIILIDDTCRITAFNPAAERIFGYAADEVLGQNVKVLMPPPYREEHDGYVSRYLRTGERKIIGIGREVVGRRKDGSRFPLDLAVSEIRQGRRRAFAGVLRDITERKEAEEALRRERDFAESLVETAQVIVLALDAAGRVVRFNHYMEEVSGYRLEEVAGRDWFSTFIPADQCPHVQAVFEQVLRHRQSRGTVNAILTKDGALRQIEWYNTTLQDAEGQVGVLAIGQDITERLRAERHLETQYRVTRALAESATRREAVPRILQHICEGVGWDLGELWYVDRDANVLRWDGIWQRPALRAAEFVTISRDSTFAPGSGLPGQVWRSGEPVWVNNVATGPAFERPAAAALIGLRGACAFPIRSEHSIIGVMSFFASEVRNPDADLLLMLDALGRQIGDFLERKRTESEFRELQKRSLQRERLADIGAITAQIVHDVGNPLAGISMQAQLVLRRAARDAALPARSVLKQVEIIFSEAQRLDGLVREFMEFSGEQRLNQKPLHLPDFLEEVVGLWQPLAAARDIALSLLLPDEIPPLTADEDKLRRVFENLVKNAVEAIDRGPGHVRIRVTLPEAEKIRISVEDTGPGISADVQPFRLFESTKPQGTGLGLAVARQIVLAHGGRIEYVTREPHGTIFHVELPSHGDPEGRWRHAGNGGGRTDR